MKISNPKPAYDIGHFVDDCEAKVWLNDRYEQGYVVDQLKTSVIADSRDRRKEVVEITIIMKLDLPTPAPASVPAVRQPLTLRDVVIPPSSSLVA